MAKLNIIIFFAGLIIIPECMAMPVHQGTLETGSKVHYRISAQSGIDGESLTRSVRINPQMSDLNFWLWKTFVPFIVTCEACCSSDVLKLSTGSLCEISGFRHGCDLDSPLCYAGYIAICYSTSKDCICTHSSRFSFKVFGPRIWEG